MGRILHLSDLHLGDPLEHQYLDSHKGTLAAADRRAQRDVLRESLESLGRDGTLATVDAVVISGDLTNKAEADGFEDFKSMMELVTPYVSPDRVVVVPGNHDVPQEHGPGAAERYTGFLAVTRELDFVTPMLDGQDFAPDGSLNDDSLRYPHHLVGPDFVIVALNSSHFCWGTEPLPDDVFESLLSVPEEDLLAATERIRQFDVPRISNAQMRAVDLMLQTHAKDDGDLESRVHMAVLHHQLLPVSAREEFKSFESLTNLGAVSEFLVSLGIEAVLHGHKHESALFWDAVPDLGDGLDQPPARMLISAAPGEFRDGTRIGRLLTISPREKARDISIIDLFSAATRGEGMKEQSAGLAQLWDVPEAQIPTLSRCVRGASPSEVYDKVQSLFESSHGEPLHYLVCEIEDPTEAQNVPPGYPSPEGIEDVQRWMSDLASWWQLADPQFGHGVEFNHGNRIYRRWGDQVQRAVDLLSQRAPGDAATTRASLLLLDPYSETSPLQSEFPSFVLVQFQLVQAPDGWQLVCTGHFRKQEMRYWWPINVAELATIQTRVAERISIQGNNPRPGLLRTVSAFALAADRLPIVVAVPAIDRAVDQHLPELWKMAYGLIEPEKVDDGSALRRTWRRYLAELEPTDGDELPMSRRGLPTVLDLVDTVGGTRTPAIDAVDDLVGFYKLFDKPTTTHEALEAARTKLATLDERLDDLYGDGADLSARDARENPS